MSRPSCDEPVTTHLLPTDLGDGARAFFTGRDAAAPRPPLGAAGNLSHRRPHRPADLAATRSRVGAETGCREDRWHLMHQVHGTEVAVIDEATPPGAELRGVDGLVTALPGRPLVVQVADCVPVLVAGDRAVAAIHAGRQGVARGVAARVVERLGELGESAAGLRAVVGPAIGGCCYEVPAELQEQVCRARPEARATTRWGTPALDLPAAVAAELAACGVARVERVGTCTFEDERYFSHRRDPSGGRQVGLVMREEAA